MRGSAAASSWARARLPSVLAVSKTVIRRSCGWSWTRRRRVKSSRVARSLARGVTTASFSDRDGVEDIRRVFLLGRDVFLQWANAPVLFLQRLDGGDGGAGASERRDHRHLVQDGHRADLALVGLRALLRRRVDD